jgi:hypothetical protein
MSFWEYNSPKALTEEKTQTGLICLIFDFMIKVQTREQHLSRLLSDCIIFMICPTKNFKLLRAAATCFSLFFAVWD